jgi:hypothetical protein
MEFHDDYHYCDHDDYDTCGCSRDDHDVCHDNFPNDYHGCDHDEYHEDLIGQYHSHDQPESFRNESISHYFDGLLASHHNFT